MNIDFSGRTVVVTGAAWGLGRRITERFIESGGRLFCCDIRAEGLEVVGQKGATTKVLDLADRQKVAEWIADIEQATGGAVDVLVNNAGGFAHATQRLIEDVTDSEWDTVMSINPGAAFGLCRAAVPAMKRKGSGRIVNMSSGAGVAASRTKIHPYTAAKHAVVGLTRQMAAELGQFGITVNSVAPGFVMSSPFTQAEWERLPPAVKDAHLQGTAMRRLGTPDDIASVVMFLASDFASWVTGQVISVDGGK